MGKDNRIFVPGSDDELIAELKALTGGSSLDGIRSDGPTPAVLRLKLAEVLGAMRESLDGIFDSGEVEQPNCLTEVPGLSENVMMGHMVVPRSLEWSPDFIHASDIFVTSFGILEDNLLEDGETVSTVDNFRVNREMANSYLNVYFGFEENLFASVEAQIGMKPDFSIACTTSGGRKIYIVGVGDRDVSGMASHNLGLKHSIYDSIYIENFNPWSLEHNFFVNFDRRLFGKMEKAFDLLQSIDSSGAVINIIMEIVTLAIGRLKFKGLLGSSGFYVAGIENVTVPESMSDLMEVDLSLDLRMDRAKRGKSGMLLLPIAFKITNFGKEISSGTMNIAYEESSTDICVKPE